MKWLVTGGSGFIGCNAASRLIADGQEVIVLDNLSRAGSKQNLEWLKTRGKFEFLQVDIRNFDALRDVFKKHAGINAVLHLAAQVAVTTSVANPREDFDVNLTGTFNLLECVRQFAPNAAFLNASTNKVYGKLEDIPVIEKNGRYAFQDMTGVSEDHPVDFHSPYGCSKGGAEQYVRDYSRIYGLRTVSFRQSCIYGTRQFGIEDQGWVAWFAIAAVTGKPITIYGDGKQVRDILWIDDLVDCYLKAFASMDKISGKIYNIGGGPANTLSLLELIAVIEEFLGKKIPHSFDQWRPGDQPVFVSGIQKASRDFGWSPSTLKADGLSRLLHWVSDSRSLFLNFATAQNIK